MTSKGLVGALFAMTLLAASGAATAQTNTTCGTWEQVAPPAELSSGPAVVKAVAAAPSGEAWAIAEVRPASGAAPASYLLESRSGAFAVVPMPDVTALGSNLVLEGLAVAWDGALATPWAVGHHDSGANGGSSPVAMVLRGGFWQLIGVSSSIPRGSATLRAVSATPKGEVWAIGAVERDGVTGPLVARFDGSELVEVPFPLAGEMKTIRSIAVLAANDVWVAGDTELPALVPPSPVAARIAHFNGRAWEMADQPAAGRPGTSLADVLAVSFSNVWAVGHEGPLALILHFDGKAWTETPSTGLVRPALLSIDGITGKDLRAVAAGGYASFDGNDWTFTTAENKPGAVRRGVAVMGACEAWSIGSYNDGTKDVALFERLSAGTAQEAPAAPDAVQARAVPDSGVIVEWTRVEGGDGEVVGYQVERCSGDAAACTDTPRLGAFTLVAKTTGVTLFKDDTVKPDSDYTYRVRSANSAGLSAPSVLASVRTLPAPPAADTVSGSVPNTVPSVTDPPAFDEAADGTIAVAPAPTADTVDIGGVPAADTVADAGVVSPAPAVTRPRGEAPRAGAPAPPFYVPGPATTSPLPVPASPAPDCSATRVEIVRLPSVGGPVQIQAVIHDASTTGSRCAPVSWEVTGVGKVEIVPDKTTLGASVNGQPGAYTVRATLPNGVASEAALTLN